MANSGVFHGARAVMAINGKAVGIFTSVSYGVNYDVAPIYTLGKYGPQTTEITGVEPIAVQCSGWRIVDAGPYSDKAGGMMPKLQDLVNAGEITISIYDRQNPTKAVMEVFNCRCQGFSTSVSSRSLQEISVSFIGLSLQDEEGDQNEVDAVSLPT